MHYYQFHIGDYRAATSHLSNEEDLAYRRLLDMYYDTQACIPLDTQWVSRRIRIAHDVVLSVLKDMFQETPDGWFHPVCDRNLKQYIAKAQTARTNGKAGGRPKANPVGSQQEPDRKLTNNHKPITNINTPIPPKGGSSAISFPQYLQNCKEQNISPIPEGDPVFAYAEEIGLPHDFLRLHWLEFKERYSAPDAKKYKSWKLVFNKSVRGNWLKLWHLNADGTYVLSTVGLQANKLHKVAA